jgi:hypothetical protein
VGLLHYPRPSLPGQGLLYGCRRPHGSRRCLIKGCECWFVPTRPQTRYCSTDCQEAARQWRSWRAAQRYRASDHGKERRREQSQRYRQRQRQAQAVPPQPASEGQRPDPVAEKTSDCPCDRPGCYELFVLTPRSVEQRFCSPACRQALRRVRQREVRTRERRRQGIRPRRRRPRAPPKSDL